MTTSTRFVPGLAAISAFSICDYESNSPALRSAYGAGVYSSPRPIPRHSHETSIFTMKDRSVSGPAWAEVIDELLKIRMLIDNWDGEGSIAPQPAIVDGTISLVQWLKEIGEGPPNRVIAGVNGTVFLEWYSPLGYREIEVFSPIEAESRLILKGSEVSECVSIIRNN